jgi:regulatory protein
MSDASSERLAPVTYLPWAKPEASPGADRRSRPAAESVEPVEPRATSAAARSRPAVEPVEPGARPVAASRSRPAPDPVEPTEPFEHEVPSAAASRSRAKADGGRGRLRSVSRSEAWSESTDDSEPEETGAERDERIDRLVISRLRRSALSVSEVRAVLVEHGLDDIEVEEWIERYERLGYLDDAKLAEQVVHSHGVRRGRGSGAILQELGRRGVEDLDPETELDNARTVAERRARQLRGLDRQTAERRLSAFLQRRGYPGDVVREAVTAALAAEGS